MFFEDEFEVELNQIISDPEHFMAGWSKADFLDFLFTDDWASVEYLDPIDGQALLDALVKVEMYEFASIVRDVINVNLSRLESLDRFL